MDSNLYPHEQAAVAGIRAANKRKQAAVTAYLTAATASQRWRCIRQVTDANHETLRLRRILTEWPESADV